MNFKTTYILFATLIGIAGVFLLMQLFGKRAGDDLNYVLPSLHAPDRSVRADDIETVEVEINRPEPRKWVFTRGERGWRSADPAVRLDESAVESIIRQVIDARAEENADVRPNRDQFGLNPPAAVVTLVKKGQEGRWALEVGDIGFGGDAAMVYVASADRPGEVLAVRRSGLDGLFKSRHGAEKKPEPADPFKTLADLRSKDLLVQSALNVQAFRLGDTQKGGPTLALEKDKTGDRWRFTEPAYGEADETQVRDLLQNLGNVRVESNDDFVAEGVSDFAKYGLDKDKPKRLRVQATQRPGGLLGGDDKQEPVTDALLVGDKVDDKGEKYYARLESESYVVKVPAKQLEPIFKVLENPGTLRNKDLVQLDTGRIDAIDVRNDSGLVKLRKTGDFAAWKLYDGGSPAGAEDAAVRGLLDALTAKGQVRDFPTQSDAELGLDKPGAEISLWVEGLRKEEKKDEPKAEKPEEKKDAKKDEKKDAKPAAEKKEEKKDAEPQLKDAKPTVKLAFGKKEKGLVYVRREVAGDVARLAVPDALLQKVGQDRLAYLERKLPGLSRDDVTKVVLKRGQEVVEIARESKDDKAPAEWKFKRPTDLAGRVADKAKVEAILSDLSGLHPERFVADKPTPNDLERFGLKTPEVQATLTLRKDKATEDKDFLFGKPTDDKAARYAKLGERDLVFTVRPEVIKPLQEELADPRVLTLDAAKVRGLKLQGWQKVFGFQVTLDLERKAADPKGWAVKEGPKDLQIEGSKVDAFLANVANLAAEKFVVYKGGPKPEHELGEKERALVIEVRVEGEKTPVVLTLGKEDAATKGYFAQSSTLPGDVFVVPAGRFETLLKEGVKYFTGK